MSLNHQRGRRPHDWRSTSWWCRRASRAAAAANPCCCWPADQGKAPPPSRGRSLSESDRSAIAHDLILIDQRGTGQSNGLHCAAPAAVADLMGRIFDPARLAACRDELSTRADLTRYTTAASAADYGIILDALGVRRVHVWGVSYGTRLGYEIARRFPDRVRTLTLEGVVPITFSVAVDRCDRPRQGDRRSHRRLPGRCVVRGQLSGLATRRGRRVRATAATPDAGQRRRSGHRRSRAGRVFAPGSRLRSARDSVRRRAPPAGALQGSGQRQLRRVRARRMSRGRARWINRSPKASCSASTVPKICRSSIGRRRNTAAAGTRIGTYLLDQYRRGVRGLADRHAAAGFRDTTRSTCRR